MHSCETCGSEYTSQFAAAECEEQDRLDDRKSRDFFSNYNPHRRD